MASRLSSPSFLGRHIRKSNLTRPALLALLGISQTACPPVAIDDTTDFIQVPANLARDGGAPSEVGGSDVVDASNPPVDAGNDVVMGVDAVDVVTPSTDVVEAGTDVVDAAMPPVDVPVDTAVDAGMPCRPVSMTVSGDNINNSYDTQTAVPVVINTSGDCSTVGSSIPMNINYGPSVAMLRPVLAIDSMRNQIRTNLDLTDPMLVGFPDNHRNVRATATVAGNMISGTFLRKRTSAAILPTGTLFPGLSRSNGGYTGRIVLNMATNSASPTDDLNRDALIGIDVRDDSESTLFSHGSLSTCNFAAETNPCLDPATDGSGRTQRCFIPNMLTSDRSSGFCDISEQRVFSYPGAGAMFSMPMHSVDYNNLLMRITPGAYLRVVVYVTDIGLNVTTQTYRIRRGD